MCQLVFGLQGTPVCPACMEVYLPALQPIAPQLRTLRLPGLLHTGCREHREPQAEPRGISSFFASSWCQLELLDLTGASLDAALGAVSLPHLHALCVAGVSLRMADRPYKEPFTTVLDRFSEGCPTCTRLECQMATMRTCCTSHSYGSYEALLCEGFQALQTIVVMIDPGKIERPWGRVRSM